MNRRILCIGILVLLLVIPGVVGAAGTPVSHFYMNITEEEPPSGYPADALYLTDFGIQADGSDETTLLQDAFDFALANGNSTIVFPEGGTIGVDDYIETWENIELAGNWCTIKLIDSASIDHGETYFKIHEGTYTHDLIFDGNQAGQTGDAVNGVVVYDNSVFSDNEVKNVGAYSLNFWGDNIVFDNNYVHDSWQYGISAQGDSNNITITNNTFIDCGEIGIKMKAATDVYVYNNHVYVNNDEETLSPIGIAFSDDNYTDGVTLDENTITITVDGGIGIWSGSAAHVNIYVTDNVITGAYDGISATWDGGEITGNYITFTHSCITNTGDGVSESGNTCVEI